MNGGKGWREGMGGMNGGKGWREGMEGRERDKIIAMSTHMQNILQWMMEDCGGTYLLLGEPGTCQACQDRYSITDPTWLVVQLHLTASEYEQLK